MHRGVDDVAHADIKKHFDEIIEWMRKNEKKRKITKKKKRERRKERKKKNEKKE